MREVKFRAYQINKKSKIVKVIEQDSFWFHDITISNIKPYIETEYYTYFIVQYTGLKDKNGVEIYEGDIVRLHNYNTPNQYDKWAYEVYYLNKDARYKFRNKQEYPNNIDTDTTSNTNFEIIGNIHENPELLEQS